MRYKGIAVLIGIVLLGGCADNTPYVNPFDRYYANLSPEPVETAPITDETQQACNKFAADLLQQLDKSGENLFFSPFALMVVLGMTLNGAQGETHRQMVQALGYDPDQFDEKAFNQQMYSLLNILKTADDGVQLRWANGVWVDQSIEPNAEFLRTVLSYYASQVFAADFANNPNQAARGINRWVSEQTNSMIDRLFEPSDIDADTAIVLVNALYFDAKWQHPFPPAATRRAPFYLEGGGEKQVQMMIHEKLEIPYLQGDGFQAIALPYRIATGMDDSGFSFYLFLPDEEHTVGWLRERWTAENWRKWHKAFDKARLELQMPRFNMVHQCNLRDALIAVGMENACSPQLADFGRMTTNQEQMWIGKAFQRSLVELDEQGTRAISIPILAQERSSRARPRLKIVVDRPFLFAIVHEQTGIVLFLGIVREP